MTFWAGFWQWAGEHPFLTTIIALSITNTIQVIVKAIRGERQSPNEDGGQVQAQSEPAPPTRSRARTTLRANQIRAEQAERPVRRRTMWERISRDD
jgi:hypothetical protein